MKKALPMLFILFTVLPVLPVLSQVHEEATVYLRDIRVHVTDRQGKPIRGLTAADFIVKESKEVRETSFFQEVDFNPIAAAEAELDGHTTDETLQQPQFNMLVLDSSNMSASAFKRVQHLARIYINENMRPNELLRVIHVEKATKQLCNFTKDRQQLIDAVNSATYEGYIYNYDLSTAREMASETHGVFQSATQASLDLAQYKHLVAFSKNMIILNQGLINIKGSKSIMLMTGGYNARAGNLSLIKKLSYRLNQTNTTLHGFVHDSRVSRSTINLAQLTGPISSGVGGSIAAIENRDRSARLSGPREHVERTGGIFSYALGRGKLEQKFQSFLDRQNHYYRIGYSILDVKSKSKVKISLRDGLKGKLVYGKRFRDANDKKLDEMGEKYRDETTMLYSAGMRNDLDISTGYGVYRHAELTWAVPANATIPLRKFKKGLIVGFAALDQNRNVMDVIVSKVDKPGKKGELTFHDLLITEDSPAFVRFFVKDLESGEYSIMESSHEPLESPTEAAPASLMIGHLSAGDLMPLNMQREDQDNQDRRRLDPFYQSKNPFMSATQMDFPKGQPLIAMFQYRNEKKQLSNQSVRFAVVIDGRKIYQPAKLMVKSPFGGVDPLYRAGVFLGDLPMGEARLIVEVMDPTTGGVKETGIDFNIIATPAQSVRR